MMNVTTGKNMRRLVILAVLGGSLGSMAALAQQELKAPAVLSPNLGAKQIPLPASPQKPATQQSASQQPAPVMVAPTQPTPPQQVPPGIRSARKDPHLPKAFEPVPVTAPPSLSSKPPVVAPTGPIRTFLGKQYPQPVPASPVMAKPVPAQPAVVQPVPQQPAATTITDQEPVKTSVPPALPKPHEPSAISAAVQSQPLTPELVRLREKINDTIAIYSKRHQNTRDNTPWEVMHAFVAFNVRTEIRRDGPNEPPVNAIGWMLWGQRCNGQPLLTLANGRPRAEIGVGVQGHPGQLMAILAQSRVSIETPLKIQGKDFVLRDLLEEEKLGCRPSTELTFRLIAMSHYLDLNNTWIASDGQEWSIPRIIQEELKAPIRGAACGGTHRLFGLTYAYQQRLKRGEPLDGEYAKAKAYIENYKKYAWSLMNPDGTFSTSWFNKAENKPDVDRKIQTTGHVMEWLILSQTDEELRSPRMIRAMDYLATNLKNDPQHEWKLGPLGHALHALMMYNERVFKAEKVPPQFVAKKETPVPHEAMNAPQAPTLSPPPMKPDAVKPEVKTPESKTPEPMKTEPIKVEPNPFDDDSFKIPMPVDAPDQGPAKENLAPPKKNPDQGQEDEQSSKATPQLVIPATAHEAIDPKTIKPPPQEPAELQIRNIKPENKEPIKLP